MHVVRERLHVRKLLVGLYIPLGVATPFPSVVNIDVPITRFFHAVAGHRIRNAADSSIVHAPRKLVPTVPAHRRRSGETVVFNLVKRRKLYARGHRTLASRSASSNQLGRF